MTHISACSRLLSLPARGAVRYDRGIPGARRRRVPAQAQRLSVVSCNDSCPRYNRVSEAALAAVHDARHSTGRSWALRPPAQAANHATVIGLTMRAFNLQHATFNNQVGTEIILVFRAAYLALKRMAKRWAVRPGRGSPRSPASPELASVPAS